MDHCGREKRKTNPRETANIFSLLTFTYVISTLRKAFKKDLTDDDLFEITNGCSSERCGNKFEKYWNAAKEEAENSGKTFSVTKLMLKRWGKRYLFLGIVDFVYHTIHSILQPYALSNLIECFTPGSMKTKNETYFYASLVVFIHLAHGAFMSNYNLWGQLFGTEIKTAFSAMLYRKALRLSPSALSEISLGNIVNLITRDVETIRMSIWMFNDVWISTSQTITICTLLYLKVGPVSLLGIGILLFTIPIQAYLGKIVANLRLQTSKKTDERLQMTQEVLSTIRIIKIYTWEAFFAKQIDFTRRKEIAKLLLGLYFKLLLVLTGVLFSKLGFYVLIIASIWAGVTTDTTVIVYAISNFNDLRRWLGVLLPSNMAQFGAFFAAYKRITKALNSEELNPTHQENEPTKEPLIELKEATVQIKDQEILSRISFKITSGLTVITGSVGSGKSSLFKALLQDYPLSSGLLTTKGRISYASQEPWLFPSSIKQNILFGESYDKKRYQDVIRVCALLFDFNVLDHGDETILTDRGLNLSKGQQARINLARAIYRDSEIYLLDDCLTALDGVVQTHIFNECIKTFLKNKICILISQNTDHISEADTVIIMEKGRIKDIGKPDNKIIKEAEELIVESNDFEREGLSKCDEREVNEKTGLIETEQITAKKKVYKEIKKEGAINFDTYKRYFMYGGGLLIVLLNFTGGGAAQWTSSYSERLLTRWIDKKQLVINLESNHTYSGGYNYSYLEEAKMSEQTVFRNYSILVLVSTILELLKTYFMVDFCRRSSINIHKVMIRKIMNAVMSFFDTHLIGNVLNRFSQDLINVDENLPMVLNECYSTLFNVGGGILLILSIKLEFGIYIFLLFIVTVLLRRFYLPAGRSLKRLEASTRSPMVGHLNATLEGLTTIRSCKVEHLLIEEYDKHQDLHISAYITSLTMARALTFFMNWVSTCLIIVFITKFLFFDANTSAGDVTLVFSQVIALGTNILFGMREWAELENLMTSIERVLEYTDIKTEQKDGMIFKNWPSKGAISYEKVSLSYNNTDDYVLNKLNFEIMPNEKIGIVGRTGAGKSSIVSTLFRLYEVQGNILIDGVDIKTLSLDFLRKSIAIIPQDPVIFSGTIRSNLDPLNEFKDPDIWNALERVGVNKYITSLYEVVNSINVSFSSGQKQLICLARAILHKNKIVVMDEATANMDQESDEALNKIITENFADATIISIAHRLRSILECDKVMVLDRGQIKEFDNPSKLVDNPDGIFYKMVKQAGLLNYSK